MQARVLDRLGIMQETDCNLAEVSVRSRAASQDERERQIVQRHQRSRKTADLTYEFTSDPGFLHQYYVLRSLELSKVTPVPVPPKADAYDERAHILVVRQGRQVIGGVRMVVRRGLQDDFLYMERNGWELSQILPELDLAHNPYCEISKLSLLEEFQNSRITKELYRNVVEKFDELGMVYGFAISSLRAARIHRRSLMHANANHALLSGIKVPLYEGESVENPANRVLNLFDTAPGLLRGKNKLLQRLGLSDDGSRYSNPREKERTQRLNYATSVLGTA